MTDADSPQSPDSWQWKIADAQTNERLRLRYEPGNWGDVLKGAWAMAMARFVAAARPGTPLHYLDPFAGAPTYPLAPAARARLAMISGQAFAQAQAPYCARSEVASTALLVRDEVLRQGGSVVLHVLDRDPARQAAWSTIPQAVPLQYPGGAEALAAWSCLPPPGCVLIDPYDLLDRYTEILPQAMARATESCVLFYLYNKSPRSGGHWRGYRALRRTLERATPTAVRWILGRIPADAILPRAFHEVILAGPEASVSPLAPQLRELTERLGDQIARAGAFEASWAGTSIH